MKAYLKDIIPKIKKYSQKLDDLTLLTNKHWVVIDEIENSKLVYVFRNNNELIIARNGSVNKGKWEHIGNSSLLLERPEGCFLFRHGFFDENVLALKVDGLDEYALLINQNNYEQDINSIDKVVAFLESKYIINSPMIKSHLNKTLPIGSGDTIKKNENDPSSPINRNGKYGFINMNGDEYIPFIYKYAERFSEGLAVVKMEDKFGYINNNNEVVINIIFDGASSFKDGKASVNYNGDMYYIDKYGERI